MKKLQFLILSGILTFTISCGQQKRFVSYKIQEGETMEDVAKRLEINREDLMRLNPDVGQNPSPNTVIVIPNPKIKKGNSSASNSSDTYAVVDETPSEPAGTKNSEESSTTSNSETSEGAEVSYQTKVVTKYETHKVKPGETVYRITKNYGITKEELIALNPEFPGIQNNVLSIGQVLKVKAIEETITLDKETVLEQYLTHTVQSKETVFSITRRYNITKEDLLQLNPEYPELKDNALAIGQLLKIKPIEEAKTIEDIKFYRDSIQLDTEINLAILLPFKSQAYDTLSAKKIFTNNKLGNMVTDFYLGASMAIDSLKKQGININTQVFDTGNRGKNIEAIIDNDELDNADVVIGPFYSDKVTAVSKHVNAPVIFPHYSNKQHKLSGGKIIKVAPEKEDYANYLSNYMKANYHGETIFLVGDSQADSKKTIQLLHQNLKQHDSIRAIHSLYPKDGYIKKERFTNKMKAGTKNWVVIVSNDKVAVADALNSMIGLPDDMEVQVFAVEKNKAYNSIDNNKLANINFTYVTAQYADEASQEILNFNKKYQAKNNALPSDYAIKGFDITYDTLMRLASGNSLSATFKEGISFRLENKFDYRKKLFGTTSNRGLFIVQYNRDLSLKRLK
ncbi:conserved hypothetical protein [Tenacibaculum litopenaei]|uniref:LysM peptidoglycan-binding domain-containing protein n=1 Tax=Tenacibaculum litopenaei TaxID=396016 RepID=UPI0038933E71